VFDGARGRDDDWLFRLLSFERDDVPALGLIIGLFLLKEPADEITWARPARHDHDERGARFLAGVPRGVPPVAVPIGDHIRRGFLGVLDRIVENAEMHSLTGRRTTDAGGPQSSA
jgi:hypothetical protein